MTLQCVIERKSDENGKWKIYYITLYIDTAKCKINATLYTLCSLSYCFLNFFPFIHSMNGPGHTLNYLVSRLEVRRQDTKLLRVGATQPVQGERIHSTSLNLTFHLLKLTCRLIHSTNDLNEIQHELTELNLPRNYCTHLLLF
jgi:hypothetical protein